MKKFLALNLAILTLISLTACQKVSDWEAQKAKTAEEEVTAETTESTKATETTTPATDTEAVTDPAPVIPTPEAEEPAPVPQETKTFNITAREFEFTPNTISVNEGDKVVVNLTSEDIAHGFAVTEYDISEIVPAGTTKVIEFTANKKGTFTFKSPVDYTEEHPEMTGNLLVN